MNKFFDVFAKGKRRKESFSTLCCADNVYDNHSSRKIVFKYYQFDSDRYSILSSDPTFGSVSERREECDNGQTRSPSGTESFFLEPEKDCSLDPRRQNSPLPRSNLLHRQLHERSEEKSGSKGQVYMIHISNSKSFHIGPQSTININPPLSRDKARGTVQTSAESKLNLSKLLDCKKKLNEDYIALISLHLEKKWKEFGRNLGLEKAFLEEQEVRNGSNGILIAYDMLHKYLTQFPNTSLGFIIFVLAEIHCKQLIEKLAHELKFPNKCKEVVFWPTRGKLKVTWLFYKTIKEN